ncbi:MAG: hypothetical protein ACFB8W_03385 [Elainellaceae cyanobacterium]
MFAPFIPPSAQRLSDRDAIALLHRLRRKPVPVPGLISAESPTILTTPRSEDTGIRK